MSNNNGFPIKGVVSLIVLIVIVLGVWGVFKHCFGYNDNQNYQIVQSVGGNIRIQDQGGWYWRGFSTVWTWQKTNEDWLSSKISKDNPIDDSIEVVFNDGGIGKVDVYVRYEMPTDENNRKEAHIAFSGNPANIKNAIRAVTNDVLKNTAPIMSASEHQSARKSEFKQLCEEQLRDGLYKMRRVSSVVKDTTDAEGKAITIYRTEIVTGPDGKPVIDRDSPLEEYGIRIIQFSITDVQYDKQTVEQFTKKKESFLAIELAKTKREEAVQERLKIEEDGRKNLAQTEAEQNVIAKKAQIEAERDKEIATIEATKKLELETIAKKEAEVKGAKLVAVAELEQKEALVRAERDKQMAMVTAEKEREVAKIRLEAAKMEAESIEILAKAKAKELELANGLGERDKFAMEIERDIRVKAAEAIGKGIGSATWPQNIMIGGGNTAGNSSDITNMLMNMFMLKNMDNKGITSVVPMIQKSTTE